VTKQINTCVKRRTFGRPISRGSFGLWCALVLSGILFQLKGQAQGNLVNLYNWSNQTVVGYDPNPSDYVNILSSTSASFFGDYSKSGFAVPILSDSLNTVPGVTYEINFTLEDQNIEACTGYAFFGNTSTDLDLPPPGGNPFNLSVVPVSVDFSAVATSVTTTMSFEFSLDSSGIAGLSNLSVTEVPEVPDLELVVFLGFVLWGAKLSRRLPQMRACNAVAKR
jgi:hypothetical protein